LPSSRNRRIRGKIQALPEVTRTLGMLEKPNMSTELSPDKNRLLEKLVADGRFPSRQEALDRAVDLLREEAETVEDIREGLASIERGEGTPLDEAVHSLRSKHGIPEDA
jgi:Arc/MetJ-type ribon-helix-helix transcriptional regulator